MTDQTDRLIEEVQSKNKAENYERENTIKLHNLIHGIETKLRDLPKIHKTLSKSFGMQRKTLLRVIELEKQVDAIAIIVENIEEGLEDVIRGKKKMITKKMS